MTFRHLCLSALLAALGLAVLPAAAATSSGRLMGVVVADGSPQLGASVVVMPEERGSGPVQLLTNAHGLFRGSLVPGVYSVRVTLAGFLPAIEQHVRIDPRHTTLLKVELDSVFSSLDRLRHPPNQKLESDEWDWVLRTSAATRPVLRWADGEVVVDGQASQAEVARRQRPHGRVELATAARGSGAVSNLTDAPTTTFVYDQGIGQVSHLLLAGQVSYEHNADAGFAATWLPSGEAGKGWTTTLLLRQSKPGPTGPYFRGARLEQDGQLAFGTRASVHYGADYVLVSLGRSTSSLKPHASVEIEISPSWHGAFILATGPWPQTSPEPGALQSASDELDGLPTLMLRSGRPVLERAWHEEAAIEHNLSSSSSLKAAIFRDQANHTAIFGRGDVANPDFFQGFFSDEFVYDAGNSGLWGTRVAFQQKVSDDVKFALVYSWAGALAPKEHPDRATDLRHALKDCYRHSLAARVSTHVPHLGTQVEASYDLINGPVVTRPDVFGEATYRFEPYMNLSFRQPLPTFLCCRLEALADFHNLLAQGYVPVITLDGRTLLVPSARSFRGGLSVQF